jgi:uncharacterized protein (TIGR00725 family)
MSRIIVGVMGPGGPVSDKLTRDAYELGKLIAQKDWVLLSGGRGEGVMDAVNQGAKSSGGLTIGVLPGGDKRGMSTAVDVAVVTGMGSARNNINVLSSDIVIAVGLGAGTASEIALALKAQKKVILVDCPEEGVNLFCKLAADQVAIAQSPSEAVSLVEKLFSQ